jgi:hypothetical protein
MPLNQSKHYNSKFKNQNFINKDKNGDGTVRF